METAHSARKDRINAHLLLNTADRYAVIYNSKYDNDDNLFDKRSGPAAAAISSSPSTSYSSTKPQNYYYKIRDFLNFIINKEVLLQHFEAIYDLGDNPESATILFPSSLGQNMNKIHVKSPFLFYYREISEQIDSILNKWFQIYEETPEILDIYFSVMYNTQSYLSNNFLMLFTALEVYHRVFLDKIKSKEVYSKRIGEIYDRFDDILPRLSSKIENKSKFVTKIVELRNNLVHGKIRYDKINNEDLFWEQKNLQLLLQLCILCMLCFTTEKIKQFYLLDKIPIE